MKKVFLTVFCIYSIVFIVKAQDVVKKANNFINLLSDEQKTGTLFPFDNDERYNFHFVPFVRKGITFNEMNAQQTEAGLALLRSCLSDMAYKKATDIVAMEVVLKEIENNKVVDFGFNALTNNFESMLTAGVVDPAKVTRSALQNGASVAVMILTTECLVTDLPEKEKAAPQMPGGMGGMGGDY